MATVPEDPNQGTPFHGDPCPFPCFGNVGPPYIATLILLGLTMGLSVWFSSTPVVSNDPTASQEIPPFQEH